jgi:predicted AlkP superfamily pyrophosphatase or phosphodiesterase
MRHRSLALIGLLVIAGVPPAATAGPVKRPKLFVLISVDQMRADYIERYGHQWTAGLRRLVDRGARFSQAAFPYMNTVTCAGHATIGTGAFPRTHGMALNQWWDREAVKGTACTDDPAAENIGHMGAASGGDSGHRLLVPTFADELRAQSPVPPKIVSMSLKARSAIGMAGHRGTAVVWFDSGGGWTTSTAFAKGRLPWLERFSAAHPVDAAFGKTWTKLLPDSAYLFRDDGLGEKSDFWTATFPHVLRGTADGPDRTFREVWQDSPLADEALGALAISSLDEFKLGLGPGPDMLAVSFSVLDRVGHDYGPMSHEVQDVLARLDVVIGRLLDAVDRHVGAGNRVVAFTGDHGVSPIPEQMSELGADAGRLNTRELARRLNAALVPHLGDGQHVAAVYYTDVYFRPGVYDKLAANPDAMRAAMNALTSTPGIERVFRSEEIGVGLLASDPVARAIGLSYVPSRSGDLLIVPRPYWITSSSTATHGTFASYDTRVPVVLIGPGIRPGEYLQPATPADIAPTFAWFAGITLPRADGRVLREAIDPGAAAPEVRPSTRGAAPTPTAREH